MDKAKYKNALFAGAKTSILEYGQAFPFKDITKSNVTYNSKNVISIRWTYYYRNAFASDFFIGGWTYSLKTGKKLNIFDVSQGSKKYIKTRLYNAALKFGATESELSDYHPSKVNFFLKRGKVYAYPSILVSTAAKSIVFNSRYKY